MKHVFEIRDIKQEPAKLKHAGDVEVLVDGVVKVSIRHGNYPYLGPYEDCPAWSGMPLGYYESLSRARSLVNRAEAGRGRDKEQALRALGL